MSDDSDNFAVCWSLSSLSPIRSTVFSSPTTGSLCPWSFEVASDVDSDDGGAEERAMFVTCVAAAAGSSVAADAVWALSAAGFSVAAAFGSSFAAMTVWPPLGDFLSASTSFLSSELLFLELENKS
jgi:hypothetical protein